MNQRRPRGRNNNNNRGRHQNPRNQTFDSNGPGGRVRGSASQVLDRYLAQARDAQAAGDSILAENLFQHAEHYYRVLSAANAATEQQQRDRHSSFEDRHASFEDRRGHRDDGFESDNDGRPEDRFDRADRQEQSERIDEREEYAAERHDEIDDMPPRRSRRISNRRDPSDVEANEYEGRQRFNENSAPPRRGRVARSDEFRDEPALDLEAETEGSNEIDAAFLKTEPKPRRRRRTSSDTESVEVSD
jgi:hypothetical protein